MRDAAHAHDTFVLHQLASVPPPLSSQSCVADHGAQVATPFSRCRAFCRWMLRAGHKTLPAPRFRRLRGGIFGWMHKQGPIARPLTARGMHDDETIEAKLKDAKLPQEETIDLE